MAERGGLKVMVVGMSDTPVCGARDHATVLAAELESRGMVCSSCWLSHEQRSLKGAAGAVRAWVRGLDARLAQDRPDVVLLHYSVFAFSFRGLPLFVRPVTSALRRAGVPVVTIVHEAVYASRSGRGMKGRLWTLAQSALLIEVMRCSAAVLVTADFRARWLASRRWLPSRPVLVAPVFSNLLAPRAAAGAERDLHAIGVFGYSYEGSSMGVVLDALELLRAQSVPDARLELLGAPGADSASGAAWLDAAGERGLQEALSFSGRLSAQDLSDRLAACGVLVFADRGGPSSRKGSLAGALASGTPVVALDGPYRWSELRDRETLRVIERAPEALAAAIGELLGDMELNAALGARGRAFAEGEMGVGRTADTVIELLEQAGAQPEDRSHVRRAAR